ncbi:MAG: CvpA family protein [Thermodesulfobacteriota bacterium]
MSFFDAIVLAIAVFFLARGIWRGFIRQLASIAALVAGYLAVATWYPRLAPLVAPLSDSPVVTFAGTYAVIFLAAYLCTILAGQVLKAVVHLSLLGWIDRSLGAVFGLAKAAFLATLLFMLLSAVLAAGSPFLRQAVSYPYLSVSSAFLIRFLTDPGLRERFLPREPAIPGLPEPAAPAQRGLPPVAKKPVTAAGPGR